MNVTQVLIEFDGTHALAPIKYDHEFQHCRDPALIVVRNHRLPTACEFCWPAGVLTASNISRSRSLDFRQ
jgi:hypothetical protein